MGFYIETISGLQSDRGKGPVWKFIIFSLPVFMRYATFLMWVKKYKSTQQCFTKIILVVFHPWSLISSHLCSIIINRSHSLYWGYAQPESAPKECRQTRLNRGGIFYVYTFQPYLGIMWPMCWDKVWRNFQSLRRKTGCQNLPQQVDTLFQRQFLIHFQWNRIFNNI